MKIINLQAENIKKIVAVEITPTGEIVTIAGPNGAGKTSILDSIWWALAGTNAIQDQPIRNGSTKARIRLDMGEIIVERKFTSAGSTLAVTSAKGTKYNGPQKMLDALLGQLSFDPLAFARMPARQQCDELRKVCKLSIDVDQIDAANKADFDTRTVANREAKARRAQLDGIVIPTLPAGEVADESVLLTQMESAAQHNADIQARKDRRAAAKTAAETARKDATAARARAAELRAQVELLTKQAAELEEAATVADEVASGHESRLAAAPPLPEPTDVSALRQQIEAARASAVAIARRNQAIEQRKAVELDAQDWEAQAEALTVAIDKRNAEKAKAIAESAMPVPGLGFGDGVVTFNGVPFEQSSTAEQLRVSLAIAMAANPKVRVIRIQDGSLLDDTSMAAIAALARDNDYQVWVERVDTTGKVGIVIEDGHVKTVNAQPDLAEV